MIAQKNYRKRNDMKRSVGFSLIELVIVIAIISILAAVAMPSYLGNVKKGRRSDAQGALQGLAQAMERHYTENGSYEGASGTSGVPADTGAPRIFSTKSPIDGSDTIYNLWIQDATATSYVLVATPVGSQEEDGMLMLSSTGQRAWDSDNSLSGDKTQYANFASSEYEW